MAISNDAINFCLTDSDPSTMDSRIQNRRQYKVFDRDTSPKIAFNPTTNEFIDERTLDEIQENYHVWTIKHITYEPTNKYFIPRNQSASEQLQKHGSCKFTYKIPETWRSKARPITVESISEVESYEFKNRIGGKYKNTRSKKSKRSKRSKRSKTLKSR